MTAHECSTCEGDGRIWNNADPTSGMWFECEECFERMMVEQRAWGLANARLLADDWDALTIPPRTIAGHLASGIDPRLAAEWEA